MQVIRTHEDDDTDNTWGEGLFAWGLLGEGLSYASGGLKVPWNGLFALDDTDVCKLDQSKCSIHHYIISWVANISDFWFEKTGFFGVCFGFSWGFDLFLLGDEFFERFAWGRGFQGLVCLGTSILALFCLGICLGWICLGLWDRGV